MAKKPLFLFQGDSITDANRNRNVFDDLGFGYVKEFAQQFPQVQVLNRGISGNRTENLVERWHVDTLALKPDFLSIFIGINEVWHGHAQGKLFPVAETIHHYKTILDLTKKHLPQTKILIIEPFGLPLGVFQPEWRITLDEEIPAIRKLIKDYADSYIPLDGLMLDYSLRYSAVKLADDGVHPTPLGHRLIAYEVAQRVAGWLPKATGK